MSIFNQICGGGSGQPAEVTTITGASTISVPTSFSSLSEISSIYVLRISGDASNVTCHLMFTDIDVTLTRQKAYRWYFPNNTTMAMVPTYTDTYSVTISGGKLNISGSGTSSSVTYKVIVIGK